MESGCHYRFLLLDFGHPMNINTIENVINALKNILALGSAFPRRMKAIGFGISILNSDFAIFHLDSNLHKKYDVITRQMEAVVKTMNTQGKITVQEYKYLLIKSIEAVVVEFQKFKKYDPRTRIEIAVITKKTATVLADLLRDVTGKLRITLPNIHSGHKYKILQILSKEQENIYGIPNKTSSVDCTSCMDDIHTLNRFFKDWLLNPQQQLQIILSKDPNFRVECDADDCIVNPVSLMFQEKLEPCAASLNGISNTSCSLEIINRLSVYSLCPSLIFGIPRRLYPTRSDDFSCAESQNNSKIFKELCRELSQTGQGLLAKTIFPTEGNYLTAFHFLASDGDTLLLNDVSPDELYLPKWDEPLGPGDFCDEGSSESSAIRDCLKKIEYLDEYTPQNFSSGIYEHLRRCMAQTAQSKTSHFVPNAKPDEKMAKKSSSKRVSDKHQSDERSLSGACKNRRKRHKTSSEIQLENVHPALLTPNVIEKYRKIQSNVFKLPELDLNYNDKLK